MIKKAGIFILLILNLSLLSQKQDIIPDTIVFCAGDSASIVLRHTFDRNATITWNTPRGNVTNTRKLRVPVPGRYRLKITSPRLNSPITDSSYILINEKPVRTLRDTFMCGGGSLVLNAGNPGMKYIWSTKETSQKVRIKEPGRYWVRIFNGRCMVVDSVNIRSAQNTGIFPQSEITFCLNEENKTLKARVLPGSKLLWSTGATTPGIYVTAEGTYWLQSETAHCGTQTDTVKVKFKACECEMIIPNSFTPNEDNRNDYFFPVLDCEYTYFAISITDRWGNTVYSANNIHARWDGRFKGVPCPEDIYVYKIESIEKTGDKKVVRNGHISLFR